MLVRVGGRRTSRRALSVVDAYALGYRSSDRACVETPSPDMHQSRSSRLPVFLRESRRRLRSGAVPCPFAWIVLSGFGSVLCMPRHTSPGDARLLPSPKGLCCEKASSLSGRTSDCKPSSLLENTRATPQRDSAPPTTDTDRMVKRKAHVLGASRLAFLKR